MQFPKPFKMTIYGKLKLAKKSFNLSECSYVNPDGTWNERFLEYTKIGQPGLVLFNERLTKFFFTQWQLGMSSAVGFEGCQFKPRKWQKITEIENDAGSLRFNIYSKLFV